MRRDPRDAVRSSVLRSSPEILAGAAKSVSRSSHAKDLRPGLAPTLGEVVTEFQSDKARTDSPVRILNAQPASSVSGRHVLVDKNPRGHSRGLTRRCSVSNAHFFRFSARLASFVRESQT